MSDDAVAVLSGAIESTSLTSDEVSFLKKEAPVGLTLFSRNINHENLDEVRELTAEIQACRQSDHPPMLISVDQEGGRVARFKDPFPDLGPAMTVAGGRSDQDAVDILMDYGKRVGARLLALGINTNFAPVLDVLSNDENDSIGDRAFGRDAGSVTLRAGAFLSGLRSTGIISCAKHFPGQGDGRVDTHVGTAVIPYTYKELERRELFPFKSLIHLTPMVMISHARYPEIDDIEASRSKVIMQDILRKRLGYKGVIVSDDMTMGALPQNDHAWTKAIVDAIYAGADLVLICKGLDRWKLAVESLRREAYRNSDFARRLAEAAKKMQKLRGSLLP